MSRAAERVSLAISWYSERIPVKTPTNLSETSYDASVVTSIAIGVAVDVID